MIIQSTTVTADTLGLRFGVYIRENQWGERKKLRNLEFLFTCSTKQSWFCKEEHNFVFYTAELVLSEKEHSDWFPERFEFCSMDC